MKTAIGCMALLMCSVAAYGERQIDGPEAAAPRPWTTFDSVETAYFVQNQEFASALPDGSLGSKSVVPSANGRYFFFVRRCGNLASDANDYELEVFVYEDLIKIFRSRNDAVFPRPVRTVRMRSRTNDAGIAAARWVNNGDAMAFLGVEGKGRAQVYRLDIGSGEIKALTNMPLGVGSFDLMKQTLIYSAQTGYRPTGTSLDRYPANAIDGTQLEAVFGYPRIPQYAMFLSYAGEAPRQLMPLDGARLGIPVAWISPDGEKAVIVRSRELSSIPHEWSLYGRPLKSAWAAEQRQRDRAGIARRFDQFELLDVTTGRSTPMVEAPTGLLAFGMGASGFSPDAMPSVEWSNDSEHAILINTALPLTGRFPERQGAAYVVDYNLKIKKWNVLERFEIGRWRSKAPQGYEGNSREMPRVNVSLKQGMNQPPRAVAEIGGEEVILASSDRRIERVRRAQVQVLEQTDESGITWKTGLMLPSSRAGSIPLIVQVYKFEPDLFLPDGPFPSGFAAQPLVSRGFAVVQIPMGNDRYYNTPQEAQSFVRWMDAVVGNLTRHEGIDASRVGIVGYSRSGYLATYAITHPGKIKLAAAVTADGREVGYFKYLIHSVTQEPAARSLAADQVLLGGDGTFWENKTAWWSGTSGFNAERSQTPLLLTISNRESLAAYIETFASLKLCRKPVELMLFPQGAHGFVRARQRAESLEETVDWMEFWILGREEPDPARTGQYRRWRNIRIRTHWAIF